MKIYLKGGTIKEFDLENNTFILNSSVLRVCQFTVIKGYEKEANYGSDWLVLPLDLIEKVEL